MDEGLAGVLGDGADRLGIGREVAPGVGLGLGRLAQHVERIAIALGGHVLAALDRLVDGPAEHELLAHDLHGLGHGGPHHRLADPLDHVAQGGHHLGLGLFAVAEDPAGQHERPGRGVDQQGFRLAAVLGPVGAADLVADEGVEGRRVGHPEIGLGQAHEGHALVGREAVLRQEGFHEVGRGVGAQRLDQALGVGVDAPPRRRVEPDLRQALAHHLRLVPEIGLVDRRPF